MTQDTFTKADLDTVRAGADRPLILTDVTLHTLDPLIGTVHHADVLLGAGLVVGVGPGLITAADDDGAVVVRGTGTTVIPAVLDATATPAGIARGTAAGTLAPGVPAHLAIIADSDAPDLASALHTALTEPEKLRAVFRDGVPVLWDGAPVGTKLDPSAAPDLTETADAVDSRRVGVWIDTSDFLHQELSADGRYDETRGGQPHAYRGRYWIDGDRIDYLDDLGFWAFGQFEGDTLHHAGYTMRRGQSD